MRQTAPAMLSPAQPKPSAFLHSLDPKRTWRARLLDHLIGAGPMPGAWSARPARTASTGNRCRANPEFALTSGGRGVGPAKGNASGIGWRAAGTSLSYRSGVAPE